MSVYLHRIYGLNLLSEIDLCEVKNTETNLIDVHITEDSQLSPNLLNSTRFGAYQITPDHQVLFDAGFLLLLIQNGNSIKFKTKQGVSTLMLRQYILGSGLGVILQQRHTLTLHASAVSKNGEACLFQGRSGAGKSSTAAFLQTIGYQLVSDDLSVIKPEGDAFFLQPGIPTQKISQDVLPHLNSSIAADEKPITEDRLKYFRHAHAFESDQVKIKDIFCIQREDVTEPSIRTSVNDLTRFHIMYRNSFRFKLIHPMGFAKKHLTLCQSLYKKVRVHLLVLPNGVIDKKKTIDLIENRPYNF